MATWKERGEVPDSEDEFAYDNDASDDLEIPPLRPGTSGGDASPTLPPTTQDIWDIPASSLERIVAPPTTDPHRPSTPLRQPGFSLLSSPLSEPPSDISSDSGDPSTPERRRFQVVRGDFRELSPDPLADDFEPPARTKRAAPKVAPKPAPKAAAPPPALTATPKAAPR
ncbi:hypothetical protein IMZ48_24250, partial [Candidatus Bathyarchaeota archaeon]|nr:hypothetical protein [Candidatus Bathyarchaeota archaeon]